MATVHNMQNALWQHRRWSLLWKMDIPLLSTFCPAGRRDAARPVGNSQFDRAKLSLCSPGIRLTDWMASLEKGLHRNTGWERAALFCYFHNMGTNLCRREGKWTYLVRQPPAAGHFYTDLVFNWHTNFEYWTLLGHREIAFFLLIPSSSNYCFPILEWKYSTTPSKYVNETYFLSSSVKGDTY